MMRNLMRTLGLVFLVGLLLTAAAGEVVAATLEPEQAERLEEAQQHYEQERFGEAAEVLEALLDEAPTLGEAHRLLGHVRYAQGRHEPARAALSAAVRHGRITEDTLARLVEIDLEAGRETAALESLRWLAVIEPAERQYRLLQADVLAAMGASAEAAAIQRELLEADSNDAELWYRLARVHLEADRAADAAAALEQAYRLGLGRAEAAQTLAALWAEQEDLAQAVRWHELALAMLGDDADAAAHLRQAELLIAVEEMDRAEEAVRRGQALMADDAERGRAEALLGWIADARGEEEAAMGHFAAALEHGAGERQMVAAVASHAFNAGRYAEAAAVIEAHSEAETRGQRMQRLLVLSLLRDESAEAARRREAVGHYIERHGVDDEARQWIRQIGRSAAESG